MKIAKGLIAKVYVVVENFAPGVMGRLGLDCESLTKRNAKIIMASCSGFGQTGPTFFQDNYRMNFCMLLRVMFRFPVTLRAHTASRF